MTEEVFATVFEQNFCGSNESISGPGSELRNTINLKK